MRRVLLGSFVALSCFFGTLAIASSASAQSCAQDGKLSPINGAVAGLIDTYKNDPKLSKIDDWSCATISSSGECAQTPKCTNGQLCCPPGIGARTPPAPVQTPNGPTRVAGGVVGLIPAGCYQDGNCTLDDIVRTAVNFVNLLFSISGAILLLIFVYAGWLYLVGGVSPDGITKAKGMIKGSVIGIIIMFGAHTLIRFVVDAFLGKA